MAVLAVLVVEAEVVVVLVAVEAVVAEEAAARAMRSQGTNASSRWTRMRGLVPTWASSRREAVRARWASALVPFLRRSRVLRAVGEMHEPVSCAGSGTDLRAGR